METTITNTYVDYFFPVLDSNMVEICKKHPSLILAHPRKCQQYYNCSMKEDVDLSFRYRVRRLYLTECYYPDLFSTETLECENFTEVKCGNRYEVKWICKFNFMKSVKDFVVQTLFIS